MEFAERLKKIRAELLLSQREFAKEIGISHIVIAKWETNKAQPRLKSQRKVKEFCEKRKIKY
jgi:transcriptional regulator with XRE-family HTH domain